MFAYTVGGEFAYTVGGVLAVSVLEGPSLPPKASADVFDDPDPLNCLLAVFKSATGVQEVPFRFLFC